MLKATLKWAIILASLLALGPLVSRLMMNVRDVDGGRAVTFLVNGGTAPALIALASLAACMLLTGIVASKLYGAGTGMLCAGFIAAWTATAQGNLESIVRRAGGGQDLFKLSIEGLVLTVLAGFIAVILGRVSATPVASEARPRGVFGILTEGDTSRESPLPMIFVSLAAGLIVTAAAVWLLALSGARNQTLAAAIVAGVAAGAINHTVSAGRTYTISVLVPILSMALFACLAPILVKTIEGPRLLAKIYDGSVLNLARPVSLDWVAGALIGVPFGMSWANSKQPPK